MAKARCAKNPSFVYRPSDRDGARLLEVLGARRMAALQDAFGGRRVWIPKPEAKVRCLSCRSRDRCIRAWRREGRPVGSIARSLGISQQTVYRVLGLKAAP